MIYDLLLNMTRASTVQAHRGITKALLVSGDLVTSSSAELDQLGVLANLQALISLATDVSKYDAATLCSSRALKTARCRLVGRPPRWSWSRLSPWCCVCSGARGQRVPRHQPICVGRLARAASSVEWSVGADRGHAQVVCPDQQVQGRHRRGQRAARKR